ncbi:hypothetical protein [Hymenobacter siberiensis]|uniref:hypothetical protein n=1 Tax=Hymenobacter siberiensis TaxID=2848396 RepID=UPI001C1E6707|nr:hypothetical protein [Hymenobacter siberiensis]MBU6120725.1 hypothetical protein [Hymenobacter siberiensis]
MAHVLRLHPTGANDHEGWGQTGTGSLSKEDIAGMLDPDGGQTSRVAVAIPSPFARMHLVKTALAAVAAASPTATLTASHRLVGHFWDLWELIFNYHQLAKAGQRLQVRVWQRQTELAAMRAKPATEPLAEVLALYLNDPEFRDVTELYLFYHAGSDGIPRLVGGTSPLTLLFPAPAPPVLPVQRPQGGGQYFDERYVPLAARETAFVEFIYRQFVHDADLVRLAGTVRDSLDPDLLRKGRLEQDAAPAAAAYPALLDAQRNPVAIAGVPVRVRPDENTVRTSDLRLVPTRATVAEHLPLVLRPGLKMPGKMYFNNTALAESGSKVPATDPRPVNDRTLPGQELPYPYLTLGDLLEETLLMVPYEVDQSRFYCGTVKTATGYQPPHWPLLPIKAVYFDYFEPKDLAEHLSLELEPACVRVRLRLPVTGGHVEYERAYYDSPQGDNLLGALGQRRVTNVALSFFPFVKLLDAPQYNDFYKVMLVDANNTDPRQVHKPVTLKFGVNGLPLSETGTGQAATRYVRTPKTGQDEGSTYYEVRGTHFDYVEVYNPAPAGGRALVVPLWKEVKQQGTKRFRFAIDFGTTSTHVAWHDAPGQAPQPLSFGPEDSPVVLLKKPTAEPDYQAYDRIFRGIDDDPAHYVGLKRWRVYQQREFVPPLLGVASSPYAFPIRTATSEAPGFAVEQPSLLGNVNVGFGINTEEDSDESYRTNLKWETGSNEARNRVEAFFREMLLLFKYKAALNGGNLAATKVVWFAPLSFPVFSRIQYQNTWDRLFREIFHVPTESTVFLPESTAPYFYLTRNRVVTPGPGESAVFIDIGGGTSDVLLYADRAPDGTPYKKHQPVLSTSFRFAGNDLWGDGAVDMRGRKDNGLVAFGLAGIEADPLFSSQQVNEDVARAKEAKKYLEVVRRNPTFGSEEIASLLFNYDSVFRFGNRLLHAPHLRVLFYLHFGALVYHVGQVVRGGGYAVPRYLCLTGRGSLYVRLLSGGSDLRGVETLARLILGKVFGTPPPANFKIVLAADPKQTTANGGVMATGQDGPDSDAEEAPLAIVHPVGTGQPGPEELRDLRPADVTEAVKTAVLANVEACLHLLLEDSDLTRLQPQFGIKNAPGEVLRLLRTHLADSFNMSRQFYADSLPQGEIIPETLFFLPLRHALYELSRELYASQPAT